MEQEMQAAASASTQHAEELCAQVRSLSISRSLTLALSLSRSLCFFLARSLSLALSLSLCFALSLYLARPRSLALALSRTISLSLVRSRSVAVPTRRRSNRLGRTCPPDPPPPSLSPSCSQGAGSPLPQIRYWSTVHSASRYTFQIAIFNTVCNRGARTGILRRKLRRIL